MKKYWLLLALGITLSLAHAQQKKQPMKEWKGNPKQPFILFFSGDGGLNNFSSNLCQTLDDNGYRILAIDSKAYFWNRKTPEQLATEMIGALRTVMTDQLNPHFILMGYSFGADAIPFLANRLPEAIKSNLLQAVMLEPSTSTDLEIHLSDMIGRSRVKRSLDVIAEINQMKSVPILLLMGSETKDFPTAQLHVKNMSIKIMEGDHHFDGNKGKVFQTVLTSLKQSR